MSSFSISWTVLFLGFDLCAPKDKVCQYHITVSRLSLLLIMCCGVGWRCFSARLGNASPSEFALPVAWRRSLIVFSKKENTYDFYLDRAEIISLHWRNTTLLCVRYRDRVNRT